MRCGLSDYHLPCQITFSFIPPHRSGPLLLSSSFSPTPPTGPPSFHAEGLFLPLDVLCWSFCFRVDSGRGIASANLSGFTEHTNIRLGKPRLVLGDRTHQLGD